MPAPIQIVGGGLAGLTLGIELRQAGVAAVVHEAGAYPRNRVCGEFLDGRGQSILAGLGLKPKLFAAGVREGWTVQFEDYRGTGRKHVLGKPAWRLSRWRLDALLAEEFQALGGELTTRQRWQGDWGAEGVIRATGRRVEPGTSKGWTGLKCHMRGLQLTADLEVHALQNGYVGLCEVAPGMINVCGIFRAIHPAGAVSSTVLSNLADPNTSLRVRLNAATVVPGSECSVAGISFAPPGSVQPGCVIGDSISMIAPVAGNGMSMAIESAHIAAPEIIRYSAGEQNWKATCRNIATRCRKEFSFRLRWARILQGLFLTPALPGRGALLRSRTIFNFFYALTR